MTLKFLVIRRDNIGDLVCTTPLLAGLRRRYPEAHIAALVNTYNAEVLAGNPDVDAVYAYEKSKHRGPGRSLVSLYAGRLRLMLRLRREAFDTAILAAPGFARHSLRLARMIGAKHILGYVEQGRAHAGLDIALPYARSAAAHEVEEVYGLLRAFGVEDAPPPVRVFPDPARRGEIARSLAGLPGDAPVIGIHISARRQAQQWPAENFAALMRAICERGAARFVLLWAPGEAGDPRHPGDDEKARRIVELCKGLPLLALPTVELSRLIAALSACDRVVCADGGAMHIAAALGKPILCLFGDSPAARWRPWRSPHELLQPASRDLKDLSVAEALDGFERLVQAHPSPACSGTG